MHKLLFHIIFFSLWASLDLCAAVKNISADEEYAQKFPSVEIETATITSYQHDQSDKFSNINYKRLKNNSSELLEPTDTTYMHTATSIINFCAPNTIMSLAFIANSIWNSHLYGELGGYALSSDAVTTMWKYLIIKTATSGLKATLTIVSQLNTPEHSTAIGNVNKAALVSIIFYSACAAPFLLEAENIIGSIGIIDNPAILKQMQSYFNGFTWGLPATLFLNNDEQFSLAIGDNYIPLMYECLYASLSGLIAYPLAFGKWGLPALGTEGIGHAMSAGAWITWLTLRTYYFYNEKYTPYKLFNFYSLRGENLKKYLSYAIPLTTSNFVTSVQRFFSAQFISSSADEVPQAYSISSAFFRQVNSILWISNSPINKLIANNIPRNLSEKKSTQEITFRNNKRLAESSLILSLSFATTASIPTLIWPDSFIKFFGGEDLSKSTIELTKLYMLYNFGNTMLSSYIAPLESIFFGLGNIREPVIIHFANDIVTISIAALAAKFNCNPNLIVAASLFGNIIGAILYSICWWQVDEKFFSIKNSNTENTQEMETNISLEQSFS